VTRLIFREDKIIVVDDRCCECLGVGTGEGTGGR